MKTLYVSLRESDIVNAFDKAHDQIEHPDAPSVDDLCRIRSHLPDESREAICLHWLRNVVVKLRKSSKLSKKTNK